VALRARQKASVMGIKGPLKEGEIENTRKHARAWAYKLEGD